ncbi:DUF3048 domain-containing protein [Kitasatospora sp. NPDC058965]|uniref:DUF3048 domain-containing protein n=1 Tax=Kitasatospora sp. NPDC058965 TaxID=3346682 RepID=UPI0036A8FA32
MHPRRARAVVAGAVLGLLLAGCGGSARHPGPSSSATGAANPLDNVGTAGNVLAVKIDNVTAHIQAIQQGLAQADIVYWIQVEGGQSRFLAVFDANHLPATIGPVRSARQTDIPLLQQYGHLDLAYSGAISGLLPLLARADLQNVTPVEDPDAFSNRGVDPTFVDPQQILARYPSVPARSPGFTFGPAPDGGSALAAATWHLPAASIGVRYEGGGYRVAVDGHPAWSGTATVVVQHVSIVPGDFTDFNAGHPDNEVVTRTVGAGPAQVLRDGQVWNVQWSRPDPAGGTAFTLPNGRQMPFATGPVLVVLVP